MPQNANSPTSPRMVRIRMRDRMALRLRNKGKEYEEIAEVLGYANGSGAHKAVARALKRVQDSITQEAGKLRAREVARIDELISAIWERAIGTKDELGNWITKPELPAVDRVVKLLERKAKLLGLDVSRLELTGAAGGPVDIRTEREQVVSLVDRISTRLKAVNDSGEPE